MPANRSWAQIISKMRQKRVSRWLGVVYMVLGIAALRLNLSAAQSTSTFVNPVLNIDFPDPDVLKVGNTYYAYATNGNGFNIQVTSSTDLVHWQRVKEALLRLP